MLRNDRAPVLLVVAAMPPLAKATMGGNHRYLLSLAEATASSGIETHVISDLTDFYDEVVDGLVASGCRLHRAPFCSEPSLAAIRLDELIAELRPDFVHVNGHQGWLERPVMASKRFHRVATRIFTMHLPLASLVTEPRWPELLPPRWAWRERRRDRRFIRRFDRVISVSRRYGELLAARGHVRPDAVVCIPNAIEARGREASSRKEDGTVVVGAAGNLIGDKRFDVLLRAMAILTHRLADEGGPRIELRIAGEGEDGPSLRALASELGLDDCVAFLGYRKDMPAFYSELDVFCMSSDAEAMPFVALEAMAAGLPLVVTDVGDLPYMVVDGVNGHVVKRGRPGPLADRLHALIDDHDRRASFGRASRRRFDEEYSLAAWRRRTLAVYR